MEDSRYTPIKGRLIGKTCYACGSIDVVSLYGIFPICGLCLENANEEYQESIKQDKERSDNE